MGDSNTERPLSVQEAAEFLDLHPDTVRRKVREGEIKAYRLGKGRRLYFKKADLLAALEPVKPEDESNG